MPKLYHIIYWGSYEQVKRRVKSVKMSPYGR